MAPILLLELKQKEKDETRRRYRNINPQKYRC